MSGKGPASADDSENIEEILNKQREMTSEEASKIMKQFLKVLILNKKSIRYFTHSIGKVELGGLSEPPKNVSWKSFSSLIKWEFGKAIFLR